MPDLTSLLSRFLTQLYNGTWVGGTIDYTNNAQIGTLADARLSSNVPLKDTVNLFTGSGITSWTADHATSQSLRLRNTLASATSRANFVIGNDAAVGILTLQANSSIFTTAGINVANGASIFAGGAGGLALSSATMVNFYTATTALRGVMSAAGGFSWGTATDPGATNVLVAGFVDAASFKVGGVAGASKAAGAVTSITVVNGLVTAIS